MQQAYPRCFLHIYAIDISNCHIVELQQLLNNPIQHQRLRNNTTIPLKLNTIDFQVYPLTVIPYLLMQQRVKNY